MSPDHTSEAAPGPGPGSGPDIAVDLNVDARCERERANEPARESELAPLAERGRETASEPDRAPARGVWSCWLSSYGF